MYRKCSGRKRKSKFSIYTIVYVTEQCHNIKIVMLTFYFVGCSHHGHSCKITTVDLVIYLIFADIFRGGESRRAMEVLIHKQGAIKSLQSRWGDYEISLKI